MPIRRTRNLKRIVVLNFPQRLYRARKDKGWTQKVLGEKCGFSGAWIAHYESGNRKPCIDTLKIIARTLKVSTDYLLGMPNFKEDK